MTKPAQFLGVDTTNEDGTAACWHCGLPTRGGDFLPGHDAKLVAVLVSEVKYGNLTAEAVLAAFPAYRTGLRNKVARQLVKAGLLKVGYADSAEGQQSE